MKGTQRGTGVWGVSFKLDRTTFKPILQGARGISDNLNFEITGTNAVALDTWTHLAFTWDGTTSTNAVKLYVNGAVDVSGTAVAVVTQTGTRSFWVGRAMRTRGSSA